MSNEPAPWSKSGCAAGLVIMVWYGMVWCGMVWYGMVWYGMVWYGMVWYGMVWYGMVWYGMVWYGKGCNQNLEAGSRSLKQLDVPAVSSPSNLTSSWAMPSLSVSAWALTAATSPRAAASSCSSASWV
jgi:hypothetical protein